MPKKWKKKEKVESAWNELLNNPEMKGYIPHHNSFSYHPNLALIRTLITNDFAGNSIDIHSFFKGRGRSSKAHTIIDTLLSTSHWTTLNGNQSQKIHTQESPN